MSNIKITVAVVRSARALGAGHRELVYLAAVPVREDGTPAIPPAFRGNDQGLKCDFVSRTYYLSATSQSRNLRGYARSLASMVNAGEIDFATAAQKFQNANEYLEPKYQG